MDYNQIPPERPMPPPDEWHEQQQPVSPDYGQPEKPHSRDDWDTSRNEDSASDILNDMIVRDLPPRSPSPSPPPAHDWLDAYIEFSRYMSPEGYEHFHEACGIWLLSTVAARRVYFLLGGSKEYTPIYMMLTAISTEFAKTETAKSVDRVLNAAHLGSFLLPQETTPESFISELSTGELPDNYSELPLTVQYRLSHRKKFQGQGAWLYDEFGGLIDGMMSQRSYLSGFKSLLRVFHNCPNHYERTTMIRGHEFINEPYLAFLGITTPTELRKHAKRGGRLWNDGFWARFGVVCPHPREQPIHKTRGYSTSLAEVPVAICEPLVAWHKRLGERDEVDDPLPQTQIRYAPSIWDQYDHFRWEVKQRRQSIDRTQHGATDLFSYESRMPMQCLRIAALLASVEGGDVVEARHWGRARAFCDVLLAGATNLYEYVNAGEPTKEAEQEDRVIRAIKKGRAAEKKQGKDRWPTERNIVRAIGSTMSQAQIREHLDNLLALGVIKPIQRTKRRKEYELLD